MQDYKKDGFDLQHRGCETMVTYTWQAWLSAHVIQAAVHYCDLWKCFFVIEHCEHVCQTAWNTGEQHTKVQESQM